MTTIIDGTAGITFPNSTVQASAGSVLQVVSTTFTDSTTIASTSFTDITGATASITPKFATSKILVLLSVQSFLRYDASGLQYASLRIVRGASTVQDFGAYVIVNSTATSLSQFLGGNYAASYLDSPASTSSLTYKLQSNVLTTASNGRILINEAGRSSACNITLMEIAA